MARRQAPKLANMLNEIDAVVVPLPSCEATAAIPPKQSHEADHWILPIIGMPLPPLKNCLCIAYCIAYWITNILLVLPIVLPIGLPIVLPIAYCIAYCLLPIGLPGDDHKQTGEQEIEKIITNDLQEGNPESAEAVPTATQ